MKKISMALLALTLSLNAYSWEIEPSCETFLKNYSRVISNGSFDSEFFLTVEKAVTLSDKELYYNSLSSNEKLKPISRLYAYCKLDKSNGLNTKLSLAVNRSF